MTEEKRLSEAEAQELQQLSQTLRTQCLKMIHKAQSGHPGGTLSALDLIMVLYKKILKLSCTWRCCPEWESRDRFVLSKGHASAALYTVLADCGYFDPKELEKFRQLGSMLQGHPSCECIPGIEVPSGSLGQGLSMANGIALALKLDKNPAKVFVLMGDGEQQEGQVWEAAMSSAHYKLDNLIAIVDRNRLQIDGDTESIMAIEPLADKWKAFGWEVLKVNGHNHSEIYSTYLKAIEIGTEKTKPVIIIADTVKGKGISFMENDAGWHGKPTNEEQLIQAIEELKIK